MATLNTIKLMSKTISDAEYEELLALREFKKQVGELVNQLSYKDSGGLGGINPPAPAKPNTIKEWKAHYAVLFAKNPKYKESIIGMGSRQRRAYWHFYITSRPVRSRS